MKPVVSRPAWKRGCAISADRNADIVAEAADVEGVERLAHGGDRGRPVVAIGHELGDHRIVEHADLGAFIDAAVDAHRRPFRRLAVAHQAAGRGQEVAQRVLGIDPRLDRPAVQLHVGLLELAASRRRRRGSSARPGRDRSPSRSPDARPAGACSFRGNRSCACASTMNSTVPADLYCTALASATACSPIALRVFSSRNGLGASSITFWWRRWIEHSRSPR